MGKIDCCAGADAAGKRRVVLDTRGLERHLKRAREPDDEVPYLTLPYLTLPSATGCCCRYLNLPYLTLLYVALP